MPLVLALGWELAVRAGWSNGRLVPPPSVIYATFAELAKTGELQRHALATLARVAAGFGLGVGVGTLLGAITGYSMLVRRFIDPSLQALRAIPSIAWVPLFILWLGIFEASKVTLIAVGVFFPVYLGVMGAVMSVDRKIVEVGRVFRLSGTQMVRRILLARGVAGLCDRAALGAWSRLDVRGGGRIHGRVRGTWILCWSTASNSASRRRSSRPSSPSR